VRPLSNFFTSTLLHMAGRAIDKRSNRPSSFPWSVRRKVLLLLFSLSLPTVEERFLFFPET